MVILLQQKNFGPNVVYYVLGHEWIASNIYIYIYIYIYIKGKELRTIWKHNACHPFLRKQNFLLRKGGGDKKVPFFLSLNMLPNSKCRMNPDSTVCNLELLKMSSFVSNKVYLWEILLLYLIQKKCAVEAYRILFQTHGENALSEMTCRNTSKLMT